MNVRRPIDAPPISPCISHGAVRTRQVLAHIQPSAVSTAFVTLAQNTAAILFRVNVGVVRAEECVRECHRVALAHSAILEVIGVDVEKDGHVDRLTRQQPLLVEAETLNSSEIQF